MRWRSRVVTVVVVGVVVGSVVGWAEDRSNASIVATEMPLGRVTLRATALEDARPSPRGAAVLVRPTSLDVADIGHEWEGPPLLVRGPVDAVVAGELIEVSGHVDAEPELYRGGAIGGEMRVGRVRSLGVESPWFIVGNALRHRVLAGLDAAAAEPGGALVVGFLIGDVRRLPDRDIEALRRAGLSHFVAVSGSNVALFLGAWWIASGPLAMGPRRRAIVGLIGLSIFVVVTRWEPSVVRAALMAGIVLVGRFLGRPVSAWTALGAAVTVALIAQPMLAGSVGFALSVAATAGILIGGPLWSGRSPRVVWTVLGATISAQVAVAPLIVWWFGSIPLLAPVANLLAAPLVTLATATGGIGALLPIPGLVAVATSTAEVVLAIAHTVAGLPQLDLVGAMAMAAGALVVTLAPAMRSVGSTVVAIAVVISITPGGPPAVPTVAFLDVGQGDAALFRGADGATVLVDGGGDPDRLTRHLESFGVDRIDLLVVSHRHADHVVGLSGLFSAVPVGMVWHPDQEGEGSVLDDLLAEARSAGVPTVVPRTGDVLRVGAFSLEVLGPRRRYLSPNDMSLVLSVSVGPTTVIMAGDIETHAQRDLGPLRGTILKVPHQGAATSDLEWLSASAPTVAVVSVGPNDFGHPADSVIATLAEAGATVLRTDRDGTIEIPLG